MHTTNTHNWRSLSPFGPIALACTLSFVVSGCLVRTQGASTSSSTVVSAAESGYRGVVTLENRSSAAICRIESDGGPTGHPKIDQTVRIEPGASGTFEIQSTLHTLWLIGCDGMVLFGKPHTRISEPSSATIGALTAPTITLEAEHSTTPSTAERRVLAAEMTRPTDFLNGVLRTFGGSYQSEMNSDTTLRAQALAALRQGAEARRYPESFLALRLTESDWSIARHRVTGAVLRRGFAGVTVARFPDGHCQATPVNFVQEHDGSDFSGDLRLGGLGGNHHVPCAIAELAGQSPDWGH